MLKVGDRTPDFKLQDQNGKWHTLNDYKGKKVLIYFYPRDFTAGCTIEACSLRDSFPKFNNLKAVVLGVSTDSVESHRKFADKHQLPFTLLADTQKEMVENYGVWQKKKFLGKSYMGIARTSFLIDEKGKILKIYQKVKPPIHAAQVLSDLQ